ALREALRKSTGLVIQIPVKRFREVQALRHIKAEGVNVGNKQQQTREFLASRDNAELRRLLDRISGVATGIGHADDFSLRRLRLQQERGEIRRIQGMLDAADNLAPRSDHNRRGIALQCRAEGVVSSKKEPAV